MANNERHGNFILVGEMQEEEDVYHTHSAEGGRVLVTSFRLVWTEAGEAGDTRPAGRRKVRGPGCWDRAGWT